MLDCVREVAAKEFCNYGKRGSFEHMLFLFTEIFVVSVPLTLWRIGQVGVLHTMSL